MSWSMRPQEAKKKGGGERVLFLVLRRVRKQAVHVGTKMALIRMFSCTERLYWLKDPWFISRQSHMAPSCPETSCNSIGGGGWNSLVTKNSPCASARN